MAEVETVWRLLRKRGVRPALVALGSILALGVANNLTEGSVKAGADFVREWLHPSTFVISYSKPLDPKPSATVTRIETGEPIKIRSSEKDVLVVAGSVGNYRLNLQRTHAGAREVLPIILSIKSRDEMVSIETSDEHWASTMALAQDGDGTYSGDASRSLLSETRWVIGNSDSAQARLAATPLGSRIVAAALAEVGVAEKGTPQERARIAGYWSGTNLDGVPGTSPNSLNLPWGGALLGHVVRAAGAAPPKAAPSFFSWLHWGEMVQIGSEAPGDVLVFSANGLPEAGSRLLAGVLLRKRPDCFEVIAGNIANRSVITCVHRPIRAARRATLGAPGLDPNSE